jgi:predicted DNA-binding transcriptional regulator AlpA
MLRAFMFKRSRISQEPKAMSKVLSPSREAGHQRFANVKDVAKYLGVTPMCLWRWRRNPELGFPQATEIGRTPRYDLNEIDQWMKQRVVDRSKKTNAVA